MIEGIETREGLEELQGHCEAILELLGENKYREGLVKTPYRVAKAMQKLTCGYGMDPKAVLNGAKYGYITGLSKIPRVVDIFSHRLQVQERLTTQIKECIQETLDPLGVMVVIEAKHMCMQMRGIEKQNSITTTSDFTGAFNQAKTRQEFMNLINHRVEL